MGGKDPYSASKGASELITDSYINSFFNEDNSCSVATGRAGNVIGGGDWADNRIVPDFFKSILNGEKFNGGWNFGPLDKSNYNVAELISGLINYYGKGDLLLSESKDKLHEANMLKLDISKAAWFLKWQPVLSFDELIKFTVDGYDIDINNDNVYRSRVKQLSDYVELAKKRNIEWAK